MMTAFSPGLSDSIASLLEGPRPCPHCESSSQIAGGLCVGCLLEAGLDAGDEDESETLTDVLAEVRLPDQNWRLGNYEILEEIGRGGMGVIYRARQRHSRRIVAVKRVLSYHSDSRETLARFRREAQAAASLDHPNILPIYEVSESEDGLPFFSMKFAPGGTLQQVAPALRKDPRQCVALVAKITRAVQYAHSRGILHRDLKPGNILIDGRGEPLVSDFGLAKWLDTTSDLTRTLTIFGTPGYIAPEQASAAAADLKPTADIYSLGAILFDLLAGRPPFLGAHALSVIRQAADSPAPKLRTLSKLADRDLETICSRCLDRDSKLRYPSAHDLAEDLERWLEGRPIIARPVSPPVEVWRWCRRNPILAGSCLAIILLAIAGMTQIIARSRLTSIVERAEIARRSVGVTSFEDLDELTISSRAADSATLSLLIELGQTKGIYVRKVPESSQNRDPWRSDQWKSIGATAETRMVLTGSVRQRQGKQRIAVHLVEAATGSPVRTWLYDVGADTEAAKKPSRDITEAVLNTLTSTSSTAPLNSSLRDTGETTSAMARSYCDRGKEFFSRFNLPDVDRAIESFRKAIELDPDYALAYALLGSACQARAQTDSSRDWLSEADAATATALRLAPMLPEAHRARGNVLRRHGNLRESLDSFLTAYELDPGDVRTSAMLGDAYQQLGQPDLSIGWFEKANRRLTQPLYADNQANAWTDISEYAHAESAYKTSIVFKPDLPVGLLGLSRLALFRGEHESARRYCAEARRTYANNPEPLEMAALIEFFARNFSEAEKLYREASALNRLGGIDSPGSVRYLSAIGFIVSISGPGSREGRVLLEEARALDEKQLQSMPHNHRRLYSLAANCAALGRVEAATTYLQEAVEAGWIDHQSAILDPRFDSIRGQKAFIETLGRLSQKIQNMRQRLILQTVVTNTTTAQTNE